MTKTAIKIGAEVRIDASRSGYHGMCGKVESATLDQKGRPAAVQVRICSQSLWFAASAINPIDQEQAA